MEIRPMEAELYADGRTERYDTDNTCFSQFCGRT
jgi:hypothetical protein